jgi:hypothetical protein
MNCRIVDALTTGSAGAPANSADAARPSGTANRVRGSSGAIAVLAASSAGCGPWLEVRQANRWPMAASTLNGTRNFADAVSQTA